MNREALSRGARRPGRADGPRAENRRQRTRALVEAALALFLERGIEGVTIDDLTRGAAMAKGSFYRYFRDKEDLVAGLLAPVGDRVLAALARCEARLPAADTPDALVAAYGALAVELAAVLSEAPDVVRLYLQEGRSPGLGARRPVRALADAVGAAAVRLTEAARALGLLRPMDARIAGLAVVGAVERLLFGYLSGEDVGDPSEVPEALVTLVVDGLRAGPGAGGR